MIVTTLFTQTQYCFLSLILLLLLIYAAPPLPQDPLTIVPTTVPVKQLGVFPPSALLPVLHVAQVTAVPVMQPEGTPKFEAAPPAAQGVVAIPLVPALQRGVVAADPVVHSPNAVNPILFKSVSFGSVYFIGSLPVGFMVFVFFINYLIIHNLIILLL